MVTFVPYSLTRADIKYDEKTILNFIRHPDDVWLRLGWRL